MKLGYDIAISERLEELLKDETFGELLRLVENDLKDEIFRTPEEDQRNQIYHEMHALNRVKLKLSSVVDSLKMERYNGN